MANFTNMSSTMPYVYTYSEDVRVPNVQEMDTLMAQSMANLEHPNMIKGYEMSKDILGDIKITINYQPLAPVNFIKVNAVVHVLTEEELAEAKANQPYEWVRRIDIE